MAYETVLFEAQEHIAILTLNRPERLNAITGAGRGFCSGGASRPVRKTGPRIRELVSARRVQPERDTTRTCDTVMQRP
jgi:enoyl-CoA hydratase/carnithine racemase